MVALDEFGNVLGHGMVYRHRQGRDAAKKARSAWPTWSSSTTSRSSPSATAPPAARPSSWWPTCLAEELKDRDVAYVIVNEAGASIYSTSPLGREELPQYDALQRGAISIGRRLLDPLSELVKIDPANIGVGLYQHDMKAKHLQGFARRGRRVVRELRRRRCELGQPGAAALCLGHEPTHRPPRVRVSPRERPVQESRRAEEGRRLRRRDVRAGRRLLEDHRRRESARRHLDSSRKLRHRPPRARTSSAATWPNWPRPCPPRAKPKRSRNLRRSW